MKKSGKEETAERHKSDPVSILRLRAEARAVLQDPSRPRDFIFHVVKAPPRDIRGNVLPHDELPIWASDRRGRRYELRPGETVQELEARVLRDQSVGGETLTWVTIHM